MERLEYDEFRALFRSNRRAWHLELRDTYNVEGEDEPFDRFLRGEPDSFEWLREWLDFVSTVTSAGTLIQRVRVVTEPHADYTRFGFVVAPLAIKAGEDIRYLPRRDTADIEFPQEDLWLFDDDTLVWSVFSEDGRTGGFAREHDRGLTAHCRTVRDQVWARATPYAEYVH
ncbi:MAG TPA: hypothetical protein VGJ07_23805 [Rugosimonospora sp.]|jgi:hypothetical protein